MSAERFLAGFAVSIAICGCQFTTVNLDYCSNINGDAFCESRRGGSTSYYCLLGTDACVAWVKERRDIDASFDGCIEERPPDDCYSPCGGGGAWEVGAECSLGDEMSGSESGQVGDEMSSSKSGEDGEVVTIGGTHADTADSSDLGIFCGDGSIDGGEDCDGTDLKGASCVSRGFDAGELSCGDDCAFDESGCISFGCGNDIVEGDEVCDGSDLAGIDCMALGHSSGVLSCASDCSTYDTSGCCGDGVVGANEDCDGLNLGGHTCAAVDSTYSGDGLACASDCTWDTSGCCGDGTVGVGELCDGDLIVNGVTCETLGFAGGNLACDGCVAVDTTNCDSSYCDGIELEEGELCDGNLFGGATCESLGFHSGDLQCVNCTEYDTSGCAICGNGVVEGSEECDEQDLSEATCTTLDPLLGGDLACQADCTYDTSACVAFSGDCCSANGTPGCDNFSCTAEVCSAVTECCVDEWDPLCVGFATSVRMCLCGLGGGE